MHGTGATTAQQKSVQLIQLMAMIITIVQMQQGTEPCSVAGTGTTVRTLVASPRTCTLRRRSRARPSAFAAASEICRLGIWHPLEWKMNETENEK